MRLCAVRVGLSLLAMNVFAPPQALSAEVDASTRSTGRTLAYEGIDAYEAGDFARAEERLSRAYSLLKVPSLALWLGRTLEAQGNLVEAAESYLEATRLPADSGGDPTVQEQAKQEAKAARERLLPEIPQLVVIVTGAPRDQVQVTIDGQPLAAALLGEKRATNPGLVHLRANYAGRVVEMEVSLAAGQVRTAELRFEPPVESGAAEASPAPPLSHDSPNNAWMRPTAWAAIGTGAAALGVWGVTGAMALSDYENLSCPNNTCDGSIDDDQYARYQSLRTAATISFVAGVVLAMGGTTLLLASPRRSTQLDKAGRETRSRHVTFAPLIGPALVEIHGRF